MSSPNRAAAPHDAAVVVTAATRFSAAPGLPAALRRAGSVSLLASVGALASASAAILLGGCASTQRPLMVAGTALPGAPRPLQHPDIARQIDRTEGGIEGAVTLPDRILPSARYRAIIVDGHLTLVREDPAPDSGGAMKDAIRGMMDRSRELSEQTRRLEEETRQLAAMLAAAQDRIRVLESSPGIASPAEKPE